MGADFLFVTLPFCKLTKERLAEALAAAKPDENDCYDMEAIEDAIGQYSELFNSREVGVFHPDSSEFPFLITGGMSWGDSPTEAYDTMCAIQSSGIYNLLAEWARQDKAERALTLNQNS